MKGGFNFIIGNVCMLFAAMLWGVNVSVTKALIPAYMTADSISATRLIGGCLLFWATSVFVKCPPIAKGDWGKVVAGGAIGLFAFIWLFILSLRYGNAIDISIIMTLPPMFVILIGIIFLHERPSPMEYAGLAVSFAGAVIVILGAGASGGDYSMNGIIGDLLAIASTVCYACYLVILEKPSHTYPPLALLRWVFLAAAVPALVLTPGMDQLPILDTRAITPWAEIGFILIGPTFLAYFLTQPAIKRIGAELASLYQYLLPVFAALSAVLMGLEKIHLVQVAAMAVIVIGMVLVNLGRKRRKTA